MRSSSQRPNRRLHPLRRTFDQQRLRGDRRPDIGNAASLEDAIHDGVLRDIRQGGYKERTVSGQVLWGGHCSRVFFMRGGQQEEGRSERFPVIKDRFPSAARPGTG